MCPVDSAHSRRNSVLTCRVKPSGSAHQTEQCTESLADFAFYGLARHVHARPASHAPSVWLAPAHVVFAARTCGTRSCSRRNAAHRKRPPLKTIFRSQAPDLDCAGIEAAECARRRAAMNCAGFIFGDQCRVSARHRSTHSDGCRSRPSLVRAFQTTAPAELHE